jgi:hypothetical protein
MTAPTDTTAWLDRVRKLLTKAEDPGVTPEEAQLLTEKAAELMAKYGISQALLDSARPDAGKPGNRMIDVPNPWSREHAHLLCGLAAAMRCQSVMLTGGKGGTRVHLFGFTSDLDPVDVLYTSVMLQMANGLRQQVVPGANARARAWRRSWLLGYTTAVIERVKRAEQTAEQEAAADDSKPGAALVLADRSVQVASALRQEYPHTRTASVTYSGSGYRDGHAAGQRANLGGTSVARRASGAIR